MASPMHRTSEDDAFMASLILEAAASFYAPETANARLLQCRSDKAAFIEEMKRALRNGEDEASPYINKLTTRISTLITQEAQLAALVGDSQKQVA